jgi:helix-turn-helix protein
MTHTLEQTRGALKLREAAQYCGFSVITMRRLIQRGFVKPNRATRHILIPMKEIQRFLDADGATRSKR